LGAFAQTVGGRHGQEDFPNKKLILDYIAAFNSGDEAQMSAFIKANVAEKALQQRSLADRLVIYKDMRANLKSLELKDVTEIMMSAGAQTVTTLMRAGNGETVEVTFNFDPQPPNKLMSLRVQQAGDGPGEQGGPPTKQSSAPLTEPEFKQKLESYLGEAAGKDDFSGVVLVARHGQPIFEKAYGLANIASKIPNTTDTRFNLGSMNKMFTGVSIAQLAEKGKLSFDDTISKHVPDYPNKAVADKVTIHQLLTHTSGMGVYWNEKFMERRTTLTTVASHIPLFADEPLAFEPGAKFSYSNSGFMVLGLIIERVSGQNYYDYVAEHIFKPAGMTGTGFYDPNGDNPKVAIGYVGGSKRDNTSEREIKGGPAGGGFSTVEDLMRFQMALFGNKLLSPKYLQIVTTGKVAMRGPAKYAYGFGDVEFNGVRTVGHNGGAPGIASDLTMFPDSGYTAVVMTNRDAPLMMPVMAKIRDLITK